MPLHTPSSSSVVKFRAKLANKDIFGNMSDTTSMVFHKKVEQEKSDKETWDLFNQIIKLVVPSFFSLLLADIVWQITIMYAGKLGDSKVLAAIGMVNNINMLIPVTLTFGTSRALSTLVSQAYGSGNFKVCAELSNKHMILITIIFIPLTLAMWNVTAILTFCGFNAEAAVISGEYTRYLIWGFYMDCMFQSRRMYLTSVQETFIPLMVQIITIAAHPVWCHYLMSDGSLGIYACALAQNITYTLQFVCINLVIYSSKSEELQQLNIRPSMDSFNGMWKFLELARQTLLLEALELWSYEVMAMMSGFLTITQQASMSIDWSISFLCIYIPYSFYMSVSTLVGTALGQGDVKKAKDTFRLIFVFCTVIVIVICSAMFLSSKQIVGLYAQDAKIVSYATSGLRAYIGACFPPFFVQMMLMGLISGVGIQGESQAPAIFCFLFICIPMGYYLAFIAKIGMTGIFYGQAFGQVCLLLFYIKIVYNIDWEAQVEEIKLQNQEETQDSPQNDGVEEDKKSLLTTSRYSENEISARQKDHVIINIPDNESEKNIQL